MWQRPPSRADVSPCGNVPRRLRDEQVSGFARAVALVSPPSRCRSMSSFYFFLLSIGGFISRLRRLRARGFGGNGESLLPLTDPILSRRSFSTWPSLRSRAFRRADRPSTSRAHFRSASPRGAASVRFASTSTFRYLHLFHALSKLPEFGPPLIARTAPEFLESPHRIAPVASTARRQAFLLAAPEEPLLRRR